MFVAKPLSFQPHKNQKASPTFKGPCLLNTAHSSSSSSTLLQPPIRSEHPHNTPEKGTRKMANKLVSVFLMCIVVMAALHIPQAAADEYKTCYERCNQDCRGEGNGQTFCEMKCDSDCVEKVAAGESTFSHFSVFLLLCNCYT